MRRAPGIALALGMYVVACRPEPPARRALSVDVHPSVGAVVTSFDDGTLEVRGLLDGRRLYAFRYAEPYELGFGQRPPAPLLCATESVGGRLLVFAPEEIVSVDAETGATRARIHRHVRPYAVCPAATPDGGVVELWASYHGSGVLVKRDAALRERWRHENPDVGRIARRLAVDPATGNIHAVSDTHTLVVSPDGRTNWVVPNARP